MSENIARLIDHSFLKPEHNETDLEQALQEAKMFGFNSLCYRPQFTKEFAPRYRSSVVLGFPEDFIDCASKEQGLGLISSALIASKVTEAREALSFGVLELDPVVNVADLNNRSETVVPIFMKDAAAKKYQEAAQTETHQVFAGEKIRKELQSYAFMLREFISETEPLYIKPIFSCELLNEEQLKLALEIFAETYIDFYDQFPEVREKIFFSFKNSTGFVRSIAGEKPELATPDLIAFIAAELDKYDSEKLLKIKAAGGIRDLETAEKIIAAANGRLSHLGSSAGVSICSNNKAPSK